MVIEVHTNTKHPGGGIHSRGCSTSSASDLGLEDLDKEPIVALSSTTLLRVRGLPKDHDPEDFPDIINGRYMLTLIYGLHKLSDSMEITEQK